MAIHKFSVCNSAFGGYRLFPLAMPLLINPESHDFCMTARAKHASGKSNASFGLRATTCVVPVPLAQGRTAKVACLRLGDFLGVHQAQGVHDSVAAWTFRQMPALSLKGWQQMKSDQECRLPIANAGDAAR
jgi:hypothetical protein